MKTTKNLILLVFLVQLCFLSCKSPQEDEVIEEEICIAQIFDKVWNIYPYKENLKSLVFKDSIGKEYVFDVVKFDTAHISTGSGGGEGGQRFEHLLYNEELEFYLETKIWAHTLGSPCPDGKAYQNFFAIQGPKKDVWVSEEGQSSISIYMRERPDTLVFQDYDLEEITINSKEYRHIYESDETMKIYYTIELGIVGIIDPVKKLKINISKVEHD